MAFTGTGDRRSGAAHESPSVALRKRWDPDPNRQRLYDWALTGLAQPEEDHGRGRYRRGVGVATGYWLYLWQPGSKVEVAVKSGRLIASTATQDIGTGTRTVIANIVAREFGLEPHEVEVRIGDSNLPEGPGSGGSRVTASVIPPMLLAIQKLKAAIEQNSRRKPVPGSNAPWREMLAASPDLAASGVRPEDSKQMAPGIRSPLKEVGLLGMIFGWMMRRFSNLAIGAGVPSSVQIVEVEVDTWLGHVRVVSVHTGIAVGKIAAPRCAARRPALSSRASATRFMKPAKSISHGDILSGGMEDYRIPASRTRLSSTCISTKAVSITCSAAASASARSRPCRRRRRLPNAICNATGSD
jgi:xanthine dehydrogenase YagR molybdenum-binding subunit